MINEWLHLYMDISALLGKFDKGHKGEKEMSNSF